ncbi:MAG: FKBP-type peptidyl-prolyl cis-trans isomerase [Rickettsiales bacterium]|jgi:trigger factor|nr:FKBP-type peptidyl-prolyl cis-trans isomerase [Rickettsiales bacterium]
MKKAFMAMAAVAALAACDGREAKEGDTIAIHFEGFLDGAQFSGGTGDADLKLGSGQFVPGFEDQLVGAKVGEEREVKLRFPDQYVPGLAGKDVVFKVKINGIK